jgi:hypothetical protein
MLRVRRAAAVVHRFHLHAGMAETLLNHRENASGRDFSPAAGAEKKELGLHRLRKNSCQSTLCNRARL